MSQSPQTSEAEAAEESQSSEAEKDSEAMGPPQTKKSSKVLLLLLSLPFWQISYHPVNIQIFKDLNKMARK